MKPLVILSVLLGILFLIGAVIYFIEPAKSLPAFFPGYDPSLTKIHRTHAFGSLVVALLLFSYAWFSSGKSSKEDKKE